MEILQTLVIELVVLVILAVFLELLIPAGDLSRYVRMVLGLLIIVAVLQAATGFWQRGRALDLGSLSLQPPTSAFDDDLLETGRRRWEDNQAAALEGYRSGLARQITALAGLNPEVEIEEVLVELDLDGTGGQIGNIMGVTLVAAPVVDEDRKADGDEKGNEDGERNAAVTVDDGARAESLDRLCRTIAEFYNLEPGAVKWEE